MYSWWIPWTLLFLLLFYCISWYVGESFLPFWFLLSLFSSDYNHFYLSQSVVLWGPPLSEVSPFALRFISVFDVVFAVPYGFIDILPSVFFLLIPFLQCCLLFHVSSHQVYIRLNSNCLGAPQISGQWNFSWVWRFLFLKSHLMPWKFHTSFWNYLCFNLVCTMYQYT